MQHVSIAINRVMEVYAPNEKTRFWAWFLFKDGTRQVVAEMSSKTDPTAILNIHGCHWECVGEVV